MGAKGKQLVGSNVNKILVLLNKAFADEWLAYYQYWIGSKIAHGQMRDAIAEEFKEHASEELKHAGMLAERIIQLGGTPILEPSKWYKMTNCGYESPTNPSVKALLKQNIKSERCAIEVYRQLSETTKVSDIITYQLVLEILKDEIKHEEDLEAFTKDLA